MMGMGGPVKDKYADLDEEEYSDEGEMMAT